MLQALKVLQVQQVLQVRKGRKVTQDLRVLQDLLALKGQQVPQALPQNMVGLAIAFALRTLTGLGEAM